MAMVQGTPGYGDFPNSIIRSVWDEVAIVKPSNTPIYTIAMANAAAEAPKQAKFEMQHDFELPLRITLTNSDKYSGTGTSTTYTSATNVSMFQVGAYWRNFTQNQTMQVTAVAGSAVTLVPADGSSTIVAAANGDLLEYVFFPHEQGGTIKTPISSVVTMPFNATQIFATPFGVDDTTKKTLLYQGPLFAYEHKLSILRHKAEIEYATVYGYYQSLSGTTGRQLYTTAGLKNIAQTYKSTYPAGGLTLDLFAANLRDNVFATGTEEKLAFVNNQAFYDLMQLAQGNIRIEAGEIEEYGLSYMNWESPYGKVMLMRAPSIRDPKGCFIFMEHSEFKMQYLQKTYLKNNIQLNDQMQEKAAIITECGVQFCPEEYLNIYSGA